MAGLQRSAVSFRRQGSSGLVWDDKFLSGELNQVANQKEETTTTSTSSNSKSETQLQGTELGKEVRDHELAKVSTRTGGSIERSRSTGGGGRGYRTGRVSPAIEPPSPKVSACGFCSAFGKQENARRRPPKSGKRKM
ncbi:hypothetical protein M9H77_29310 [Catharanthus roseus]|uniref:Uncharacterized protein n=1 Tax=Catharanthus roseus TaxID=4058 RepID=A0ACC0AJ95_CATRO|nr:hypothetical protein M9H77_29310 [Catharanthus roseus]